MKGLKEGQEVLVNGERCFIEDLNWSARNDYIMVVSASDASDVFGAHIDSVEAVKQDTLAAELFPEIYKILIIENERQPILQRSNVDIVADRAVSYAKMGAMAAKEGGL